MATSCYDLTREQVAEALDGLLRAKEIVLERAAQVSQALRTFGASSADFAAVSSSVQRPLRAAEKR